MEPRVLIALALVVAAVVVARAIERRRPDPPPRDATPIPKQLDRADFDAPDRRWLVVLFSSDACDSCADVAGKLPALESDEVGVQEVKWGRRRDLHQRYRIDAVPLTLVADAEGVVRKSFLGKVTATDLWAAVAEIREGA